MCVIAVKRQRQKTKDERRGLTIRRGWQRGRGRRAQRRPASASSRACLCACRSVPQSDGLQEVMTHVSFYRTGPPLLSFLHALFSALPCSYSCHSVLSPLFFSFSCLSFFLCVGTINIEVALKQFKKQQLGIVVTDLKFKGHTHNCKTKAHSQTDRNKDERHSKGCFSRLCMWCSWLLAAPLNCWLR